MNREIKPLTIFLDKNKGAYSGGKYVAINRNPNNLPKDLLDNSITFWENYDEKKLAKTGIYIGVANNPSGALFVLQNKMATTKNI